MKNMVIFAIKLIGGCFLAILVLVLLLQIIFSIGNKKLVCTSDAGNITIMYNKKYITGFTASDTIEYDLEEQREYANEVGMTTYIEEFSEWFHTNTTGNCKK